jgi:hypothetical protein
MRRADSSAKSRLGAGGASSRDHTRIGYAAVVGEDGVGADEGLEGHWHPADGEAQAVLPRGLLAVVEAEVAEEGVALGGADAGEQVGGGDVARVGEGDAGEERPEEQLVRVRDPARAAAQVVQDRGGRDDAPVEGEGVEERLEGAAGGAWDARVIDGACA